MNLARIFAVVVTVGVLSTASSQETPKPAAPPATKPAADAPAGAPQSASGTGGAQAPAAPSPAAPSSSGAGAQAAPASTTPPPPSASAPKTGVVKDNEFIPTEEIQPDEPVTFPVDI
jgi:hypothetical protein